MEAVIKYLCKKGMTPKDIHKDFMKTLVNEYPSYSTVKKWAAEFKRCRENIDDDPRSGRPKHAITDENGEIVHKLVMCDRRRDLRSTYCGYLGYVLGLGKMCTKNSDL